MADSKSGGGGVPKSEGVAIVDGVARPIPSVRRGKPGSLQAPPQVCIFGRGGWGKTSLLGSIPGQGVVVETPRSEGGSGDEVLTKRADRIEVIYAESWSEISDAYEWIMLSPEAKRFQWIGFDTLTGAKQLAIEQVIHDRPKQINMDPHKITQPEWGKVGNLLSELVLKFGALRRIDPKTGAYTDQRPLPIFWTAQEKRFTGQDDEGEKYTFVGPDTSPASLLTLVPTLMLCGRITAFPSANGSGYDRRLRIGPHPLYLTKTRAVDETIPIPRQVRVGTPIHTELFDIIQYLRGKVGLDSLDVVVEEAVADGDILDLVLGTDGEADTNTPATVDGVVDDEPTDVGNMEVLAG